VILVGIPVHHQSFCHLETLLDSWLSWHAKHDFLIVFNGQLSLKAVKALSSLSARYRPLSIQTVIQPTGYLEHYGALRRAQEFIRSAALRGGYTHLLFNEVTRIPSRNCLDTLIAARVPVAGALYKDSYVPGHYCVYSFYATAARLKLSLDQYRFIDEISEPTRVQGMGFGFVLIDRKVLEVIKFRCALQASDSYFFLDLSKLEIPAFVCPTFALNVKVDGDPNALRKWQEARRKLLLARPEWATNVGTEYK
jgi:hypothetical protein